MKIGGPENFELQARGPGRAKEVVQECLRGLSGVRQGADAVHAHDLVAIKQRRRAFELARVNQREPVNWQALGRVVCTLFPLPLNPWHQGSRLHDHAQKLALAFHGSAVERVDNTVARRLAA